MIEFERTVGASEANSWYLNLSDDRGRSYGRALQLPHCTRIAIRDGRGPVTYAQMHHKNTLWGMLRQWFIDNNVTAGTRILVRFDPTAKLQGNPVLHLEIVTHPSALPDEPESRPEIPIQLERQLEEFLAANPGLIEEGLTIYQEDGRVVGQQYPTDVGEIDLTLQSPKRAAPGDRAKTV